MECFKSMELLEAGPRSAHSRLLRFASKWRHTNDRLVTFLQSLDPSLATAPADFDVDATPLNAESCPVV